MGFTDLFLLLTVGLLLLSIVDAVRFVRRRGECSRDRRELILGIVGVAAAVNFFTFILIDELLGGDALNGRIEAGHYYLGSHGSYTEVSHGVFVYSACHASLALLGTAATVGLSRIWKPRNSPNVEKRS